MRQKIPQLDAVRGIAILIVLAHNLHGFSSLPLSYLTVYGWMGVDLFFVLSGFLITGILLDSKASANYFRNFYARRCLRIWPLYYSVLVLMFVIVPLARPQDAAELFQRSAPWWSYPFFLQNFLVAAPAVAVGPLGVSWSLAVEELFYLVWPFFVRILSTDRLQLLAWTALLVSPLLRLFFLARHWIIYSNPFCRLDGMMAGALLAILLRKPGFAPGRLLKLAWVVFLVAAPLAITTAAYEALWLAFSLAAIASASFVFLGLYATNTWFQALLTNRFLMFTGTISYGLYLLHKIPDDALKRLHIKEAHPIAAFWAAVGISYLLAIVSLNLLEKPFLNLKRFFETKPNGRLESSVPAPEARNSEAS
ncbi:MAG TPA: acyltransferase [Candidatus Acidoferrales bacterium]|jgi:peptidoglycan/LPS O-acetylase OafA/YrhL|nr:acyltransferase [Candidatus Acidoferrales bacterium]